jgi:hypothetical protein
MKFLREAANDEFPAFDTNERLEQLGFIEHTNLGWRLTAKGHGVASEPADVIPASGHGSDVSSNTKTPGARSVNIAARSSN